MFYVAFCPRCVFFMFSLLSVSAASYIIGWASCLIKDVVDDNDISGTISKLVACKDIPLNILG